jgi:hypothetical protein
MRGRSESLSRAHQVLMEYALRDLKKPIGVAGWETTLAKVLPESLAGSLPSVEELEVELGVGVRLSSATGAVWFNEGGRIVPG